MQRRRLARRTAAGARRDMEFAPHTLWMSMQGLNWMARCCWLAEAVTCAVAVRPGRNMVTQIGCERTVNQGW